MQASRLLANLIVMGGGIMARAVVQAYRQALMSMPFVGSSFCHEDILFGFKIGYFIINFECMITSVANMMGF